VKEQRGRVTIDEFKKNKRVKANRTERKRMIWKLCTQEK
jgi:hypothetical protein